jgi:peptidoglycan/xylan/chitin deacetylase (PgdA/CDA1 family)
MNWNEAKHLAQKGFGIGSHSLSHEPLTDLGQTEAEIEIHDSRIALGERVGKQISGFCYPRGACSGFLAEAVKQAGYSYAVTTQYGSNQHGSNPLQLLRRNVADYEDCRSGFPITALRLELSGLFDSFLSIRRSPA